MSHVYVLELENDKFFIGRSSNVEKRFKIHKEGKGCDFTRTNQPKRVSKVFEDASYDFDRWLTAHFVNKYGLAKVRGGDWIEEKLSENSLQTLEEKKNLVDKSCWICNEQGHRSRNCQIDGGQRKNVQNRKGGDKKVGGKRKGKKKGEFKKNNDNNNNNNQNNNQNNQNKKKLKKKKKIKCYQCEEFGHIAKDCTEEPANREKNEKGEFKRVRKCFLCGGKDHLKIDCPNRGDKSSDEE